MPLRSNTVPLRVIATERALALIDKLKTRHGPLMFHQSGGCCDGSVPMCYAANEFLLGAQDLHLGEIGGCPFYMDARQYQHWQHMQLIIDVTSGRGGAFSLESTEGVRFHTDSRLFSEEECIQLAAEKL